VGGEAGVVVGDGVVSALALPQARSPEQRWPRHTTVTVTGTATDPRTVTATDPRTVMAMDIHPTAGVGKMAPALQCLFASAYCRALADPNRGEAGGVVPKS
jgi:hypothetical protein